MDKNYYLTKDEQRLWQYIEGKDIIDNELVNLIFPDFSQNKRNKLLHRLYKKGYLKRLIKDVYYNQENLDNFYKLALRAGKGYIGLTSALKHYGLTEYEDFTIFILTQGSYKEVELENYSLKYIPMGELFTGYVEKDSLRISSMEKTFFDCFLKIRYLNYSILTKAIYQAEHVKWREFLKYFKLAPKSTAQKAGYVLQLLREEAKADIPSYVLKGLNKYVKFPVKMEQGRSRTLFDREWKIEDNIGKEKILSWWY